MMSAPASTAARATLARYVSMLMGTVSPAARIVRIAGMIRDASSSAEIWGAPGRVDWPPMSMMWAPFAMKEVTVATTVVRE